MRYFLRIIVLIFLTFGVLGAVDNTVDNNSSETVEYGSKKNTYIHSINDNTKPHIGLHVLFPDSTVLYLSVIFIISIIFLIIVVIYLRRKNRELSHKVQYLHSVDFESDINDFEQRELFLAKVSHGLRAPISAIIGLSKIVMQTELKPVQYNNISKIKQSGEMILEIVNDILDISKIDAGELKLEKIKFDINEVLNLVSNMLSLKAEEKGLQFIYSVDRSVPHLMLGDPLRLSQILINLVENAIKFTENGNIELDIKTIDNNQKNIVGLEFCVIDHGIGMSKKELNGIFKDFSQANGSTSRTHGGIGLGIPITKQLVKMMDGTISVKSEEGKGSEFIVKIYFEKYEVNNKRSYRLPSKSLMSKKAIIVDSNRRSVELLSTMLKYFHYNVEVVSSLKWANDLLSYSDYDMIFIDENSLLKSSIDIVRDIKHEYKIKVILIESIYYQNNSEIRDIEEIDNYLLKPFNQNIIYDLIVEIYGKNSKSDNQKNIKKRELSIYKDVHILVAEDDSTVQQILQDMLNDTGFNVTFINKDQSLLEKLNEDSNVNLIFMDIDRDVNNGYEVMKKIRAVSKYDEIAIYALTANSDQKFIDETMALGMQDYVTKPLDIDCLYEKLFNLLNEMDKNKKAKSKSHSLEPRAYLYTELDVRHGLENCNENTNAYDTLLDDFLEMYSNANKVLDSTVSDGRYHDCEKFVHDLKALSLNLGGHKLSISASKIEDAILNKSFNKNSILVDRLKRDLEMFIMDINRYKEDSK